VGKHGDGVITLGITGTIGSGKSTVGKILAELGIPIIDTDEIVHSLLSSDKNTQRLVIERFGSSVVANEGLAAQSINRKALGQIVFKDDLARNALEKILHPRVRQICRAKIEEYAKHPSRKLVAFLVPLLFEAGLASEYYQTWAIVTRDDVLRDRLLRRDGFSQAEVERRLAAQWTQEKKASLADKVVDNSGSEAETRKQVVELIHELIGTGTEARQAPT
jgi:dephospho-CoA kinase